MNKQERKTTLELIAFLHKLGAISTNTYFPFVIRAMEIYVDEGMKSIMKQLEKSMYGQGDN